MQGRKMFVYFCRQLHNPGLARPSARGKRPGVEVIPDPAAEDHLQP